MSPTVSRDSWIIQLGWSAQLPLSLKALDFPSEIFLSHREWKTESIKWIRITFPSRQGKVKKRKWKSYFVFLLQRKTKNENKIWVSFSFTVENRLALRYTDLHGFLCAGSQCISSEMWCDTSLCLCRFHFVGATFEPHEFIKGLKHLSYSTPVIVILRKTFTCPKHRIHQPDRKIH